LKLNTSREREREREYVSTEKLCVRPIMTAVKREIFAQQEAMEFSSMLFAVIRRV
jgi:hypothetical protein